MNLMEKLGKIVYSQSCLKNDHKIINFFILIKGK